MTDTLRENVARAICLADLKSKPCAPEGGESYEWAVNLMWEQYLSQADAAIAVVLEASND